MTEHAAGSKLRAALWVMAGAFVFSLVYASGKLAGGMVPALVIVWIRYLGGFVTVSGLSLARHGSLRPGLASRKFWLHGLRALCGIGGLGCAVYAATAMPLADAAWLAPFGYTSVVFAALIGWAVYGDLPGQATLGGTVLIVAGGLLLIRR